MGNPQRADAPTSPSPFDLLHLLQQQTGARSLWVVTPASPQDPATAAQTEQGWQGDRFTLPASELLSPAPPSQVPMPRVDLALWLDDAHLHPLEECLLILERLAAAADLIAFAAEPPPFSDGASGRAALWPDQWARHFDRHGYVLVDLFRDALCQDPSVPESTAQNLVLFARDSSLSHHPEWRNFILPTAKRRIHPRRLCRHRVQETPSPHRLVEGTLSSYIADRWQGHPERGRISAVITFHNEGAYAQRTLNGLELQAQVVQSFGLDLEVICALDNADPFTADIVMRHPLIRRQGRCLHMSNGDVGASRNHAIDTVQGDYIAVMDGDDLYSPRWLVHAYDRCRQFELPVIVHPERIVSFGMLKGMATVMDTSEADLTQLSPLTANRWIVTTFVPRVVYECIPYTRTDVARTGFGFEDWHWNCETLAAGLHHVTALETALFYRRRPDSMVVNHLSQRAMIRPTALAHSRHFAAAFDRP